MDRRQFLAALGGCGAFALAGPAAANTGSTATVVRYPDRREGVIFVSVGKKQ